MEFWVVMGPMVLPVFLEVLILKHQEWEVLMDALEI
jgi:hypothetical protein